MGLRNCTRCGQVFASDSDKICSDCKDQEEKDFEKVKEYIWEEGQASIPKIHEATGVEEKMIQKFIREGRLVDLGLELTIECKRCGQAITSGDYCESCRDEMVSGLTGKETKSNKENKENKKKIGGRMHYKRRNKE